ncbi:MAG: DUF4212 domain-containing protein [Acidovorax sp.]|uniref:DUF4212 domain-containing protein n=1 Tax=Acidovorax sp. TaxID=1872122 RepID=UPI0026371638|nr:DUF4212 domain-containing protein [Acidovorax sp.]MDH4419065.1 DUF4212 domain-containing protein [Acidovorax sp.]
MSLQQPGSRPSDPEMAGPFPPDLHDVRHLKLKAVLLLLWALVSFGATYFARDLQALVVGGWPLGYWVAAQGAVLVFIGIVVVYGWAMNRLERGDRTASAPSSLGNSADHPHG